MSSPRQDTDEVLLLTKMPVEWIVKVVPSNVSVLDSSRWLSAIELHRAQARLVFLGDREGLGAMALLGGGLGRRLQEAEGAGGDDDDHRALTRTSISTNPSSAGGSFWRLDVMRSSSDPAAASFNRASGSDPDRAWVSAKASVSEAMWLHLVKQGDSIFVPICPMSALSNSTCPVCRTAEVVCGKWTLLVIRDLADGSSRFCELERSLEGISPRTLSLRLRALEEEGIVERHTYPEVPPRVEYALTDKGEALVPLIDDMRSYGTRWLLAEDAEPAVL